MIHGLITNQKGGALMKYETDMVSTPLGDLKITFIGHGSLMFQFNDKVIHVDPVSDVGDYSGLPKADVILITHEHFDHFHPDTVKMLNKEDTIIVSNKACSPKIPKGIPMNNNQSRTIKGLEIKAVPAYNIKHMRAPGSPFHPKGSGNGYVITFGDKKVYIAGDTENIPEMKQLSDIYIAFLPMNTPFTMTPEMAAEAALSFRPAILYPYHFSETDTNKLIELLKDTPETEVRIRKLK
jgi:L-ascorbate metabolism protein UlaG (beta-lactamase superfamily)